TGVIGCQCTSILGGTVPTSPHTVARRAANGEEEKGEEGGEEDSAEEEVAEVDIALHVSSYGSVSVTRWCTIDLRPPDTGRRQRATKGPRVPPSPSVFLRRPSFAYDCAA